VKADIGTTPFPVSLDELFKKSQKMKLVIS